MEGDGYTELDRYLDFMAQPHLFLQPGASETINMTSLFAGYTNQPDYAVEVRGTGIAVVRDGVLLTIKSNGGNEIATVMIDVRDAEGSAMQRRLCVAVSDSNTLPSAVRAITSTPMADAPCYNLAGQRVDKSYKGIVIKNGKKVVSYTTY